MFTTKKMLQYVLSIILIGLFFLALWNFRGLIIYGFRKTFYSESKLIEKYFRLSINNNTEILKFSFEKDKDVEKSLNSEFMILKVSPYSCIAELIVEQNQIEDMLDYYNMRDCHKEYITANMQNIPNNSGWELKNEIDFYIWYPITVTYWGITSTYKTQGDTYILVSKPENGKCHIYLSKQMIGWNE